MIFVHIREVLEQKIREKARIRGWVYRERLTGKIKFIVLRDSTGVIQCTAKKNNFKEKEWKRIAELPIESSLWVEGKIKKDERAPGGFEIEVEKFGIISKAERFPITKNKSEEFLLDIRHLWLRSRKLTATQKIKATLMQAAREFFDRQGWYEVFPPILSGGGCESGSTRFKLDYFGKQAYLSQSAQLYLEAFIYSLEKVYSVTPVFRAEKSRTRRHLAEFWMIEGEAAWTEHEQNIKIQEKLVSYIIKKIIEKNKEELKVLGRDYKELEKVKPPFEKITYEKAVKILDKKGFDIKWGADFGAKEERALTIDRKKPVFITKYPAKIKAFYMKKDTKNEELVLCDDLLAPEGYGEIIGGSERETDVNILIKRLKENKENIKNYEWYLDLRRYGSVPHSGFGVGPERIIRWIGKLEHIRDAVGFPRVINRLYP